MTSDEQKAREIVCDHFGADERGWDPDDGAPGIGLFSNALQVWAVMQAAKPVTVRAAAEAFNCTDAMIRAAVEEHYWMFLSGPDDPARQTIEHEGE